MDDYEIPEDHRLQMLTICHKSEQDELPEKVRKRYIYFRWHADAANHALNNSDLVHIVVSSNWLSRIPEPKPDDVCTKYQNGEIKRGDPVACQWRDEKARPGVMLGVNPERKAIIRFEGEPDERALDPERVTFLDKELEPAQ